jgi:ubiquinol-cytochrome c reductase cytochrome b subunit
MASPDPGAPGDLKKSALERLLAAIDERTGLRAVMRWGLEEPIAGGARWAYVFGSALVTSLLLQAVTGYMLMTAYAPSSTTAWASVHHIQFRIAGGWLVRGLHHFGSGATVVIIAAHLAQTALFGAYRRPRELNWWFGLVLLFVVLAFSLTGYLLPWDQKGYWATRVATNIVGTYPVIGAPLQRLMQGGSQYGSLTLTRFYALHVGVLPALLALFSAAHIALMRKHGITPPASADAKKVEPFFPKQAGLDAVASVVAGAIVFWLAWRSHGAPLDAPADPSSDYPARPEWYFLGLFQLLKYFDGRTELVGTLVVPGVAVAYLFALPLIDRAKTNALRARAPWLAILGLGFAGLIALSVIGKRADARDAGYQKARQLADERAQYAIDIARAGVPPEGPLAMIERDPKLRGEAIWKSKCASCHTIDGTGGDGTATGPELKGWGTAHWAFATIRDPDSTLLFGKTSFKGMMPSITAPTKPGQKPGLTDEEAKKVAAFVASEGTDAEREAGAKLYELQCQSCHALWGKGGNIDDYAPDLTGWGTYRWLRAQIANPVSGETYKPASMDPKMSGHMPGYADDPEIGAELDVITRWVFERAKGRPPTDDEIRAAAERPCPPASSSASAGSSASGAPAASSSPPPAPPPSAVASSSAAPSASKKN